MMKPIKLSQDAWISIGKTWEEAKPKLGEVWIVKLALNGKWLSRAVIMGVNKVKITEEDRDIVGLGWSDFCLPDGDYLNTSVYKNRFICKVGDSL